MKKTEKICFVCRGSLDKDVIALNKKMIGRTVEKFFCLECFAEYFDVTADDLINKIQDYKEQGCTLFS